MSDLTTLAEHVLQKAILVITEHGEELEPFWFLKSPDKIALVKTPWGSSEEKERYLFVLRKILEEQTDIELYIQVSEAYLSCESTTPEAEKDLPPSQRSDRKEVVLINGCTRDYKEQILWTATIHTLENGARQVGPVDKTIGVNGGRMMDLFPRNKQ